MKSQRTVALSLLLALVVVSNAQAATIRLISTQRALPAPSAGTVQTFTKSGVNLGGGGTVDLTFDALSLSGGLTPSRLLYWDADDGNGLGTPMVSAFCVKRGFLFPIIHMRMTRSKATRFFDSRFRLRSTFWASM